MTETKIIWRPNEDFQKNSHIAKLLEKLGFSDYREFLAWSVGDVRNFWKTIIEDMGMEWYESYNEILDLSEGFPWAKWFVGGKTNIVLNCIDRHVNGARKDHTALIWEGDGGEIKSYTYFELNSEINQLASAMLKLGLCKGDVAGVFLPLLPEAVITMYACFKIGVVVLPIFSGFGVEGLAERLSHSEARILFTADHGIRRGKMVPLKETADEAIKLGAKIEKLVLIQRSGIDVPMTDGRDITWKELITHQNISVPTVQLSSDSVSMIMYTSGTTGRPKGTVHTHAGQLSGAGRELRYCFDMREDDTMFWVTDFGWVMAPYTIIGSHFGGHACLLFEGVPNYPRPDCLWKIISRHKITHFGLSPTAIRVLMNEGPEWVERHNLSSLRVLGSAGEPSDQDSYLWYFNTVGKSRCPIMNISGGTEIGACLLHPVPVMNLAIGTLGAPPMGTDVDVFDDNGKSIRGEVGHLVLKQPIPSLTKGFWKEPNRYLDTYFAHWDGVWYHGDWAKVDSRDLWYLHGRSDDAVNVAGKRVGPSEIESTLLKHPGVVEAAVIGVPHPIKGEGLVCFVVINEKYEQTDSLREELKDQTVKYLGKSLRPEEVKFVKALPRTCSGKVVRGVIKKIYLGEDISKINLTSIENKEVLCALKD